MTERPKVGLATSQRVWDKVATPENVARLEALFDFRFEAFDEPGNWEPTSPPPNPEAEARLTAFASDLDSLIICHGSPMVTDRVMAGSPALRFVGELEGDRFAQRIDLEAAWRRGIRFADTNHGASYPAAEWALGLILVGLRNAAAHYRTMIAHAPIAWPQGREADPGFRNGMLAGKRVGLIGLGYIGRRLVDLLAPFRVVLTAYDPYAPRELADALDLDFADLDTVIARSDVVVCTAPLTPGTRGMIDRRRIGLFRRDAVFVNVSRGKIVDSDALVERLERGDMFAGLDVFDPEPIPPDSRIRDLPNVMLSPHIAGVAASNFPLFLSLMIDDLVRHHDGLEPRSLLHPRVVANRKGT